MKNAANWIHTRLFNSNGPAKCMAKVMPCRVRVVVSCYVHIGGGGSVHSENLPWMGIFETASGVASAGKSIIALQNDVSRSFHSLIECMVAT